MGQAPHLRNWVIGKGVQMRVITLHYITSFHTPVTPTVTNGASTKSFKFSEYKLKKMSFQKFFESISICEFLEMEMEKCGSDREVGVRLNVACILLVGIQPPCSRPDKNGGTSNPDTGNSSNDRL